MVEVGELAPEFDGPSSLGGRFRLSEHRGHPVVVYFFPKAMTSGCRVETKAFRDAHPELTKRHVTIVGVSVDEPEDEAKFASECEIPFGLVADKDQAIATKYGVLSPRGTARRVTFLIGADGKVVETVDSNQPTAHVDAAKARFLSG
ncbi:MAG TPA: peroxiredoxin [Thermoplasmata archaeon]|nr:peroxiredoxin [Thermoplasmata archaeon]